MPIEISKGFVSDYAGISDYVRGKRISPMVSFSVGEPPIAFSYLSSGSEPLSAGDYVAVAGKRTFLVPGARVALAYRRLGDMGSAHSMDVGIPGVFILFGIVGAFGGLFLGPLNASLKELVAVLLAVGALGIWWIWSMRKACRLLDQLESPLDTYSHRQ